MSISMNMNSLQSRVRSTLVYQVKEDIKHRIHSGEFKSGQRIPSEAELAGMLRVSRGTIREAIKALEHERLLRSKQGEGTFVAPNASMFRTAVNRLYSVTELAATMGITLDTRILDIEERPASPDVAEKLGIEPGSLVVAIRRIRHNKETPMVYLEDTFSRMLLLKDQMLSPDMFQSSLFDFIEQKCGIRIAYSFTNIEAVIADKTLRRELNLNRDIPFVFFEQVHYSQDDRPILYSKDYYRGDVFSFQVIRKRE